MSEIKKTGLLKIKINPFELIILLEGYRPSGITWVKNLAINELYQLLPSSMNQFEGKNCTISLFEISACHLAMIVFQISCFAGPLEIESNNSIT
ncbi:hypothetical protein BpHYR1_010609 [Brachionus plicatilis]|uniref:Uncharacterized protein n=1 Tax=Brachionus plicatilis TaxID=10195 RepID=A0A3M7S6Q0_BRAPC|nr:hypothetical protein BpHYR1_010609 [Brachionus plicatilis]